MNVRLLEFIFDASVWRLLVSPFARLLRNRHVCPANLIRIGQARRDRWYRRWELAVIVIKVEVLTEVLKSEELGCFDELRNNR